MTASPDRQDALYQETVAGHGAALARLARGYEPDPQKCEDLLQEIHLALWLSLRSFNGRCSIRTWAYRVAHNTAISHVTRRRGNAPRLVSLDELADEPATPPRAEEDLALAKRRRDSMVQFGRPLEVSQARSDALLTKESLRQLETGAVYKIEQKNAAISAPCTTSTDPL